MGKHNINPLSLKTGLNMVPYKDWRVLPVRKSLAFQWGSLPIKESHLLSHSKAVGLSNGVKK